MFVSLVLQAQQPFTLGASISKMYVTDKLSIGKAYGSSTGRLHVKGTGTSSATSALYVEDNSDLMMMQIKDDGSTIIRTDVNVRYLFGGSSNLSFVDDAGVVRNQTITAATITWAARHTNTSSLVPSSTSSSFLWSLSPTGTDASGTGTNTLRVIYLSPTWNLSASSTCDVVGIDYNPTVTSIYGQHYAALFRSGRVGIGTATPTSTFHTVGNIAPGSISSISSNTTLSDAYVYLVDCTGGAITVTLPPAADCTSREYVIKKSDVSGNTITIEGDGAETIDGALNKTVSNQYNYYAVKSNGSAWYIIGNN